MNYIDRNDIELLSLLRNGDMSAFEAIYSRYWDLLFSSAFFVLQDEQACMDIVQELFVWLWTHKTSLKIDHLKAYLSAAVKFKVANYIRANKIRNLHYSQAVTTLVQEANMVENEVEFRELKSMIEQVINALPPKCREIYSLSRNNGYSNKQISAMLDLSVKTVENQLTIALKRIRTAIKSLLF